MSYRHQRTAQRLLATHGKAGFLVRTMPEPDGAGGVVEGVEEHYTVQIAEGGYDVALRGENPTIDDLLGIMAVNANITPRRGDVLKLHDDAYTLVDVKPIAPGEPEIVFTFRARR